MTNSVGLTFSVGDTIPQFIMVTLNIIFSVVSSLSLKSQQLFSQTQVVHISLADTRERSRSKL